MGGEIARVPGSRRLLGQGWSGISVYTLQVLSCPRAQVGAEEASA